MKRDSTVKKERLDALGRTWLGEYHYSGMRHFFKQVWKEAEQYDYCVFLARRCYNLNELFFSVFGKTKNISRRKALSNNALLLEGKTIAKSYIKHEVFPRILIVDDVLIHGRSLTFFLYRLEKKIRNELKAMGADPVLICRLHSEIVQAVQIRVYLEHDENILLSEDYIWRLKSSERVPRRVWHDFSQGVSQLLVLSDVANTSFVLSTEGSLEWGNCSEKTVWDKVQWNLRERRNLFYYHSLPVDSFGNIIFAVRVREPKERVGTRWIPFVFTGGLRCFDVSVSLLDLMKETIDAEIFAPFEKIFLQKKARAQKAQLVQLILSCVVLYYFCKENVDVSYSRFGILGSICDVGKISRNFSAGKRFEIALERIFDDAVFMEECYRRMPAWFRGIPAHRGEFLNEISSTMILELNRLMESEMYNAGLKSEQFAFMIAKTGRAYSPILDDLPPLSLEQFVGKERFSSYHLYYCLCCLLMLADSGVTSIKPQIGQGEDVFQALRAGEQALFCKPRQLVLYMPAMIRIEEYYYSFGTDWIVRKIRQFQDFLDKEKVEIPSIERSYIFELADFAEGWYKTGSRLEAWNIPLLYSIDGRSTLKKEMPWKDYIVTMRSWQKEILDVCKDFLQQS